MPRKQAEVLREYAVGERVHGVTYDGERIWAATGERLVAVDPASGEATRTIQRACDAGTAFDGTHLYQIVEDRIEKIEPESRAVVATIPAPARGGDSGLTWAEGSLWVGEYRGRRIHQIDPATGAILRTLQSDRFVTGVTWVEGELWHGTWENEESELRRVDPDTGEVLVAEVMPAGTFVSGLEWDGEDRFYCGGGGAGKVRAVRRPRGG